MSDPTEALPDLPGTDELKHWIDLGGWPLKALGALMVALLVLSIALRIVRALRRRRPAALHPRLQKYAGGHGESGPQLLARRRTEAARILATSSGSAITGYEIVEQVEAVFVDGFRHSQNALEGLKAVAAMKGANALSNVHQERDAAGKCSAYGDAVIVCKLSPDGGADTSAREKTARPQKPNPDPNGSASRRGA